MYQYRTLYPIYLILLLGGIHEFIYPTESIESFPVLVGYDEGFRFNGTGNVINKTSFELPLDAWCIAERRFGFYEYDFYYEYHDTVMLATWDEEKKKVLATKEVSSKSTLKKLFAIRSLNANLETYINNRYKYYKNDKKNYLNDLLAYNICQVWLFKNLPIEINLKILGYIDLNTLFYSLRRVNKHFYTTVNNCNTHFNLQKNCIEDTPAFTDMVGSFLLENQIFNIAHTNDVRCSFEDWFDDFKYFCDNSYKIYFKDGLIYSVQRIDRDYTASKADFENILKVLLLDFKDFTLAFSKNTPHIFKEYMYKKLWRNLMRSPYISYAFNLGNNILKDKVAVKDCAIDNLLSLIEALYKNVDEQYLTFDNIPAILVRYFQVLGKHLYKKSYDESERRFSFFENKKKIRAALNQRPVYMCKLSGVQKYVAYDAMEKNNKYKDSLLYEKTIIPSIQSDNIVAPQINETKPYEAISQEREKSGMFLKENIPPIQSDTSSIGAYILKNSCFLYEYIKVFCKILYDVQYASYEISDCLTCFKKIFYFIF